MKKVYFLLLLSCLSCLTSGSFAQTTTYSYTGSVQTFTVGSGYQGISIDMAGAQGGTSGGSAPGGKGGRVQATMSVTPGQVLYLFVGGAGTAQSYCSSRAGGYNGGGNGYGYGGGGGGMTDIRTTSGAFSFATSVLVAAGGGGAGYNYGTNTEQGGDGGGLTGGIGYQGSPGAPTPSLCGGGGSQTAGGSGATSYGTPAGTAGAGGSATGSYCYSGGGGGGYYGGGSGAYGGGGGGSSYLGGAGVISATTTSGYQSSNGYLAITPLPPSVVSTPSSLAFGAVTVSTSSPLQVVSLVGSFLSSSSVTITPPSNYQISLDGSTWYTSSSPLTYSFAGNSFTTYMFVQFLPTALTSYPGNIAVTGGGLSSAYNIAVTGTGANACTGTPTPGTASVSPSSGSSSTSFTLSLTGGTSAGGLTYQWQQAPAVTGTFTDMPGGNTASYAFSGLTANTYYRCNVTCPTFAAATTNTVSATFALPASSCVPNFTYTCSSYPMSTSIASFTGASGSISDPGACGPNYVDNTGSMSVTVNRGSTYSLTYGVSTSYWSSFAVQLWIDFNDNGTFETSESIDGIAQGGFTSSTATRSITIPATAQPGAHRMRVVGIYCPTCYGFPNYPSIPPCPTTAIYYGNARDYKIIINPPAPSLVASPASPYHLTTPGTSSAPVSFTQLVGSGLVPSTGLLTVTAPSTAFKVSTDGNSWNSSILIPYSGGALTKNVYVQFTPTTTATSSGNVTVAGGGVSTVNVAVTGTGATVCSGTPTAGSAAITPSSGFGATLFSLSLSGASASGGLNYQWQSSPDNSTWTNIQGAIFANYNFVGISANTYFRCVVSCPSGGSANSASVLASAFSSTVATSSCTPNFNYTCSSYPMSFSIASLVGSAGTAITDPSGCGPNYADNTSTMSVTLNQGTTYPITYGVSTSYYGSFAGQIWIDFNNDGTFATSESVGGFGQGSATTPTYTSSIVIPSGAAQGVHRMRVVGVYCPSCYGYSNYPSIPPCPTTAMNYGNIRDYKVTIGAGVPACSGTPEPGIVSASQVVSCSAFSPNLFNVGESLAFSGLTYQWQSSSSSTSGFTNVSGATGQGYIPTVSSVGTIYYRQLVSCGSASAATPAVGLTFLAPPASITGTTAICQGFTSTLASATSGGTWSSSASGVASVGSSSGVVTGASVGTATITYTAPSTCFTTTPVTINVQPAAITGTTTVCQAFTTTLSDATSGGAWSSSNPGVATIGSSTGVVSGISGGTSVVSYTMPTGCFSSANVTVNPIAPISGSSSICIGYSATLSDASSGGTWSSSNPGVATIGSSTGVVSSVSIGSTVISYTLSSTGCSALMTLNVTNPPTTFAMTGGGSFCAGGTGVIVGLNSSNVGISYQLYNGATPVGTPLTGTGGALNFGLQTAAGSYGVVANPGTPCATTMSGTAVVTVNTLPTAYSVGGGGTYCSGGSGVTVSLSSSTIGVNYQLMLGSTPIGSPISGTGSAINFGLMTATGSYTVVATNVTTGCANTMTGSATVGINPLPTAFAVTGGGSFCLGATGVAVGLSGSATGFTYQLLLSGSPVGSPVAGTGGALSFGIITTAGLYTVVATNTTTGCTNSMSGSATVVVNPLPTVFTVTGGGSYCAGGLGTVVGLNGSTSGVNYQLFNGSLPVGSPLAGTGVAISFGNQTAAGSYTVVATNATTGCVSNMFGSVSITINPLPTSFTVTGGGGYCAGGSGRLVGLSGSVVGTNYSLFNGATLVGAASGSGGALNFGLQLAPGTYTVVATNTTTGCTGNMSGSVTITINPLPTIYTVTGGGNYCSGGAGVAVGLNGSNSGINYQLYNGTSTVGSTVAGTGGTISFGNQTASGSYTVVAIDASTTCTNNMSGSALVGINPLPSVYAVTGGGGYCSGGTGVHVGLAASNTGISYQLMNGGPVGTPIAGTGGALDFGFITAAGTYTVLATNPTTACNTNMGGSAVVNINSLPTAYTVTGGGNFCAGGTGVVVGLNNSAMGVNYQLYVGGVVVGGPVAGTGSALSFGSQTAAGNYTVLATDATTGCMNAMTGVATVGVDPLPTVYTVSGGGNYCAGGTGVHVTLLGSSAGISYKLYNGAALMGTMTGTGAGLDFGLMTSAGTYTAIATNTTTSCTNNMTGAATVGVNPLPASFTITGGGNYCAGSTGVHVGLAGSATGISYQLYNTGIPAGSPMTGTGVAIDFGVMTTAGTYSVIGTNMATGCQSAMTGTTMVVANPLPVAHTVTGGGNYCAGGTGVSVSLSTSTTGVSYQLYNGTVAVGSAVPGTGSPINFGLQTGLGIYTVVGTNTTTTCANNMTGSVTVGVNPLPVVFNVTGGGNYCAGGSGVHVGLSGSNSGISYQLWNGGAPASGAVSGTGSALDFGVFSTPGTYTVKATNTSTACTNNMSGSAVIGVSALPIVYNVTGGGNYCAGGSGMHVNLSGSNTGVSYQLFNSGSPVGTAVPGTGSALDFGAQTSAGFYTVTATNTGTACTNSMTGGVSIVIDPLPTPYTVSGGGNYCAGGAGVNVSLMNSDPGVSYQLMNGSVPVGAPLMGTGLAIDFGAQTTAGTYTVLGTNTATSCSGNMMGSVTVVVDPLPTAYTVNGGGNYCAGSNGVHVGLSSSTVGVSYQLMNGGPVGTPVMGTGSALDFGLQTATGTYSVVGTNTATSCTANMAGSVVVGINPLPNAYVVSSSTSSYCAGGTGVTIYLSNSEVGVNYQLYNGLSAVGSPVAGTGASLSFGLVIGGGSYSVIATNASTGCSRTMSGAATVAVNALPAPYLVTGGGSYCAGGNGVHIGLTGSVPGTSYQLYMGSSPVGSPTPGTGAMLDFGLQSTVGNYTVVATNTSTSCTNNMTGSATVASNPLPTVYGVTGGGNYCAGGTGVSIGLGGSTLGVTYQLYKGTSTVGGPVAGSGTVLSFGMQTGNGTYTVVATNTFTGCTNTMAGSATVGTDPAPVTYSVIGGGSYCPGASGVHVGLIGSGTGVTYQLYVGGVATGSAMAGTGTAVDFGLQTTAGMYTVKGTDNTTGCISNMTGSANVVVNPLPTIYNVVGGGSFCAGGNGVHVGLSNSSVGVNYRLFVGFTLVSTLPGTGGPIDFGLQATPGNYTVQAVNTLTSCTAGMSGTAVVAVNPTVVPFVTVSSAAGDTVCDGTFTMFTANTINGGTSPTYQWTVNGVAAGVGATYSYVPANNDVVGVTLTSSASCASPALVSGSITMTVDPKQMPAVGVSANPGSVVCQGTSVTMTAAPSYGGAAPTYSWIKNGSSVGNASTYTFMPANGDVVYCVMNSSYNCRLANSASSSHVTMVVDLPLAPVVTISSNPGTSIAPGQTAQFTATVVNGGPAPTYQWLINGNPVTGATAETFSTNALVDGDSVKCQVLSSGGCSGLVGSQAIGIHVRGVAVQSVTTAGSDIRLVPNPSKGVFTVKGSLGITGDEQVTIDVTDMLGQEVYTGKAMARKGELNSTVELSKTLANGMYILNLHTSTGNKVFHLVIEQ